MSSTTQNELLEHGNHALMNEKAISGAELRHLFELV